MGKKIIVDDREYLDVMGKDHVSELYKKAMDAWEKQKNYSLAEFYLKAAVKDRPNNEELQAKLIEVGVLARKQREEEEAKKLMERARSPRPKAAEKPPRPAPAEKAPMEMGADVPAPSAKTFVSPDEEELNLLGMQVKGVNKQKLAVFIAAGAVLLLSFFAYRIIRRDAGGLDLDLLKSISGITFLTARVAEGTMEGVVDQSWHLMAGDEKEKKVAILFAALASQKNITGMVLRDTRQQLVAEVRPDGIKISQ